MFIKAILVDDEPAARMVLRGMLEESYPEVDIVGEAKGLPEAVKLIHQHKPDVVFLDIEMPGYSGTEVLDFFNPEQVDFKIVFVTAHSHYALRGIELSALDYLLKPVKKNDLMRAMERVKQQVAEREALKGLRPAVLSEDKIAVNTGEGFAMLRLADIMYIKGDGAYVQIALADGRRITLTQQRLYEFEKLESMGNFMRTHRSYIVNIDHIQRIMRSDAGILMSNGDEVSITLDKRQALLERLGDIKF